MCELRGFDDIACGGGTHQHHLIPRAALRNADAAKKYVDSNPDVFLAALCPTHHLYGAAHKKEARCYLIFRRCVDLGIDYVREKINGVPWKVRPPEYGFEAMTAFGEYALLIEDMKQDVGHDAKQGAGDQADDDVHLTP